ncbi:MAG: hypothetical protein ACJAQ4_001954, partial [Cryomorphaceae bacterium]
MSAPDETAMAIIDTGPFTFFLALIKAYRVTIASAHHVLKVTC